MFSQTLENEIKEKKDIDPQGDTDDREWKMLTSL